MTEVNLIGGAIAFIVFLLVEGRRYYKKKRSTNNLKYRYGTDYSVSYRRKL